MAWGPACGWTATGTPALTVAAASDLRWFGEDLKQALAGSAGAADVQFIYGASGKLSTQLRHGAPFDVFLSADVEYAQQLFDEGLCLGPPTAYAQGRLALVSRDKGLLSPDLGALVRDPRVQRLAIANPEHAPYGRRAKEALMHLGVWNVAGPKLVLGDNVAQALQFVDSGAAQAGLVAGSLLMAPALHGRLFSLPVPAAWHAPLNQAAVVMKRATAAARPKAVELIAYLLSERGQALLQRHGFAAPAQRRP